MALAARASTTFWAKRTLTTLFATAEATLLRPQPYATQLASASARAASWSPTPLIIATSSTRGFKHVAKWAFYRTACGARVAVCLCCAALGSIGRGQQISYTMRLVHALGAVLPPSTKAAPTRRNTKKTTRYQHGITQISEEVGTPSR
ncbi:hypothetical protein Q3G72_024159 [Acer saccharum]|nr:hypothetical protein Q3G72_024159 [Acer saccharum]